MAFGLCTKLPEQFSTLDGSKMEKFYCLRQVHLAENLPQATHTQKRLKTTYVWAKTCFTYLGWSF